MQELAISTYIYTYIYTYVRTSSTYIREIKSPSRVLDSVDTCTVSIHMYMRVWVEEWIQVLTVAAVWWMLVVVHLQH